MANQTHEGFLTVDDALKMDKSDIRNCPMTHQRDLKVELAEPFGAVKMLVIGENNTQ